MGKYYQDTLDISTYLLRPLQRVSKYILFLENIESEMIKCDYSCENIQKAKTFITNVMNKGNNMIAVDCIENHLIDNEKCGNFIKRGELTLLKPKLMQSMVFLFENVIIFTKTKQVRSYSI